MNMIEVIKKNNNKLVKAINKCNWLALTQPRMSYSVYIGSDGNISVLEDVSGGTATYANTDLVWVATMDYNCNDSNAPMEQHYFKADDGAQRIINGLIDYLENN